MDVLTQSIHSIKFMTSRRCRARTTAGLRDTDVLQKAFEHRALRLVKSVEDRLVKDVQGGSTRAEAWNRALVEVNLKFNYNFKREVLIKLLPIFAKSTLLHICFVTLT